MSRLDHEHQAKLGPEHSPSRPMVNMKARRERNMKFVSYIREQMMQEYGFDLNELQETFGQPQGAPARSNVSPMNAALSDLKSLRKIREDKQNNTTKSSQKDGLKESSSPVLSKGGSKQKQIADRSKSTRQR